MKKIILFIGLIILSFYGFSQDYSVNQLWIKNAKLTGAHSGSQHVLFINSVSGKVYSSDDVPVSNLIVSDTIFIGDSSYIVETTDTTYFSSEKNIKIGNNSLVVDRQGNVIMDDGIVVGDSLMYNTSSSTISNDSVYWRGLDMTQDDMYFSGMGFLDTTYIKIGDTVVVIDTLTGGTMGGVVFRVIYQDYPYKYTDVFLNPTWGNLPAYNFYGYIAKAVKSTVVVQQMIFNATLVANESVLIDGDLDVTGNVNATTITADTLKGYVDPGYKVYTALLYQQDNEAPTAIILKNTLGFTPTLNYLWTGQYYLGGFESFPITKVVVLLGTGNSKHEKIIFNALRFMEPENITINTYYDDVAANNVLNNTLIEIRIYP